MPSAQDFDDFYVATRSRLVLQTFALTGDLAASRTAVRDAYVAARHHWDKVRRLADPETWVRPRAWAGAQRRHTVRRWHRERGIDADQSALLDALHGLPDVQRRVLVLHHLAGTESTEIGRELGLTLTRVEIALAEATDSVTEELACSDQVLAERLADLDTVTAEVKLPRPPIVRRSGLRRRRNHALIGSALVAGVTVSAGAFVAVAAPPAPVPKVTELVSRAMLLTAEQLAPVADAQRWRPVSTNDNTAGDGINTTCQGRRFADDAGLGTWVRTFSSTGKPRKLVQTVEISNSPGAAKAAYATTIGWYAGCREARIQLVDAYEVSGVGEQAQVLRMRIPAAQDRSFVVGVARTGSLTTSTVLQTATSDPFSPTKLAGVLAASVRDLCDSPVAGDCVDQVSVAKTLPPPSGEEAGMLAIADLPAIAKVSKPWAGTDPAAATTNPAATTCDKANFVKAGAGQAITRTYVIPQAGLPRRFGITETIGEFASAKAAIRFTQQVMGRMKSCPDKELGSTIEVSEFQPKGYRGSSFAFWRLENQVNKQQELVAFWMGVIRNGRYVAQVNLTPVDQYDVSRATFQALIARARDRIFDGRLMRRDRFAVPDGVIYLDGNSLGVLPAGVAARLQHVVEREWGEGLIRSWNDARWMEIAGRIAGRIAPLVGARPEDLHVGESTSVSLFKTMVAAARLQPGRRVLVVEPSTFPTDGYIAAGVADLLGLELRWCDPADPAAALDDDVALLSLTHVDFRTGAMFDLPGITAAAHEAGALMQWDLCHSAGAVPVDLTAADADFAVGCTYKYLNGGPGSPAFTWINPRLQDRARNPITGWMGHAAPFAMARDDARAPGMAGWATGTPPVLALSALEAALEAFDGVTVEEIRARSLALTDLFIALLDERLPDLEIVTPREHARRGSQVSFRHPEAYGIVQALIARGVIGDFRDDGPGSGIARFGFTPLYLDEDDVRAAVAHLEAVLAGEEHRDPAYAVRNAVT